MRVPTIIYADLIRGMDDKVFFQATNVAMLPGIIGASYAMPDAHWGYGFPIGGVAGIRSGSVWRCLRWGGTPHRLSRGFFGREGGVESGPGF